MIPNTLAVSVYMNEIEIILDVDRAPILYRHFLHHQTMNRIGQHARAASSDE